MRACDNPFNTERVLGVRYRLRTTTWPALLARLSELNYRAALVGPQGSGKTTLLEDLRPHLEQQGFTVHPVQLNQACPQLPIAFQVRLSRLGARDLIALDGAEQMNYFVWQRFKRRIARVGGLIITVHQPGRLPTLFECATDVKLFEQLVADLLGGVPLPPSVSLVALFARHRGNVREALRELYDLYAAQSAG